jgi:hypothetical protein
LPAAASRRSAPSMLSVLVVSACCTAAIACASGPSGCCGCCCGCCCGGWAACPAAFAGASPVGSAGVTVALPESPRSAAAIAAAAAAIAGTLPGASGGLGKAESIPARFCSLPARACRGGRQPQAQARAEVSVGVRYFPESPAGSMAQGKQCRGIVRNHSPPPAGSAACACGLPEARPPGQAPPPAPAATGQARQPPLPRQRRHLALRGGLGGSLPPGTGTAAEQS